MAHQEAVAEAPTNLPEVARDLKAAMRVQLLEAVLNSRKKKTSRSTDISIRLC